MLNTSFCSIISTGEVQTTVDLNTPLMDKGKWRKGTSINYVSMAEGGGGCKMLTDAHVGGGG